MLENFADPAVGAVSGDLIVHGAGGVLAGVGLYWRFEKWLRRQESRLWSGVGATGAVSAVRRELFRPVPRGTILDDVYWPMQVALAGRRVVHDVRALACDRLPDRARDEFRRKVRTLSGCLQLAARLPAVLLPWRNPVWLQFVSHNLLRLLAPWGPLGLLTASLLAPGTFYRAALACQAACYIAGRAGACGRRPARLRAASPPPPRSCCSMARPGSPSGSGLQDARNGHGSRRCTRGRGKGQGSKPAVHPPSPPAR